MSGPGAVLTTGNVKGTTVSQGILRQLWSVWVSDPLCRAIRNSLLDSLTADDLVFYRGSRAVTPSRPMQLAIRDDWTEFIRDAVDCIVVTGVVPFGLRKHPTQPFVPAVPVQGSYTLEMEQDALYPTMTATATTGQKTKGRGQRLYVYSKFGFMPTTNGTPASPLLPVLPLINVMREQIDTALQADALAAKPMLITGERASTYSKRDGAMMDRGEDNLEELADADPFRVRQGDFLKLSESAAEAVQRQQAIFRRFKEGLQTNDPSLMTQHRAEDAQHTFSLPYNHELHRQLASTSNPRLHDLLLHHQQTICAALGVPHSMLFSSTAASRTSSTTNSHAETTMQATLNSWKKRLAPLLTHVYQLIYGEADSEAVVSQTVKEGKAFDPHDAFQKNYVSVTFAPAIRGDLHVLKTLFVSGAIPQETFTKYACTLSGLPTDSFAAAPECALTPEERKEAALRFFSAGGGNGSGSGSGRGRESESGAEKRRRVEVPPPRNEKDEADRST